MDARNLSGLVEQLDDNIDDLEEQLAPLLSSAFSATTKKLPVLDRAKLYVLVTYTIESLLFSYIRLHGQSAKDHPVFKELTRVRQYFEKIKVAEAGGDSKRENLSLNKEAAGRIIKHGLAGNDRYDRERAEKESQQKVGAHKRFEDLGSGQAAALIPQKRTSEPVEVEDVEAEDQTMTGASTPTKEVPEKKSKHRKRDKDSMEAKAGKKEKKRSKHRHGNTG